MTFNPVGNEEISLSGYTFLVRAHGGLGALANRPIRIVGGRAQVYQLIDVATEDAYALKVMLPAFRKPQLLRNIGLLKQLSPYPGFEACRQIYITPQTHPGEIGRYPDLAYASLMPWIQGQDWKAIIGNPEVAIDADTTWELAYQLVRIVRMLERNHISHCDLSGGNLMINLELGKVTLIDFDEVYWQGASVPAVLPTGTPGYRRRVESQWQESSDRFPMAVLIAEMLGWRDVSVRRVGSGDSYFTDEDCLSIDSAKYHLLEDFVRSLRPELGELLQRAWLAPSHEECPSPEEWRLAVMKARGWRTIPLDPLDNASVNLSLLPKNPLDNFTYTAPVRAQNTAAPTPQPAGPLTTPKVTTEPRALPVIVSAKPDRNPKASENSGLNVAPKPRSPKQRYRVTQSAYRRPINLANIIVVGVVLSSIVVLAIGLFFLVFVAH